MRRWPALRAWVAARASQQVPRAAAPARPSRDLRRTACRRCRGSYALHHVRTPQGDAGLWRIAGLAAAGRAGANPRSGPRPRSSSTMTRMASSIRAAAGANDPSSIGLSTDTTAENYMEPVGFGPRAADRGVALDARRFRQFAPATTPSDPLPGTRFGVMEPNISPWRRAVSGDLTSMFDFSQNGDGRRRRRRRCAGRCASRLPQRS